MAKIVPVRGAKIRLLRDVTTRGGKTFRRGLTMKVEYTEGGYLLSVRVRAKWHSVRLLKKDYPFYFEVVELPEE